jgi:predicted transcriptional regulator
MEKNKNYKEKIRLSFDVSPEANDLIDKLAAEIGSTKSEVLRRAVVLMDIAISGKRRGLKLGLAEREESLKTEIVGI